MKIKLLPAAGLAVLLAAPVAHAEFNGSVGYLNVSDDGIDLGAIYATVGHRFELQNGFSFNPELRAGFGVVDESDSIVFDGVPVNFDLEINSLFGVATRFEYQTASPLYLFVTPSYTRIEFDASASAQGISGSLSDSVTEFGIGAGLGYMFMERIGAEVGYETIDGSDVFTGAVRFSF